MRRIAILGEALEHDAILPERAHAHRPGADRLLGEARLLPTVRVAGHDLDDRQRLEGQRLVLIGMPGAGKSTVGVLLAKLTCKSFVDTDVLFQLQEGKALQEIVDRQGYLALRRIEEQVITGYGCNNCVVATGGSAVYSPAAMAHLKRHGTVVFLDVDLATLEERVRDLDTRGLAKRPDQSFRDLYDERTPLYRKYADITIDCSGRTHDEVCGLIIAALGERAPDCLP